MRGTLANIKIIIKQFSKSEDACLSQLMLCLVVFSGALGCYFFCFLKKCSTGGRKDKQIRHGLN